MIALHSGALIAPFDANDAHHSKAETPFTTHISEPMTIGPINLAEVLISASRENRDHEMLADLRPLDVTTTPLPDDAATRLDSRGFAQLPGRRCPTVASYSQPNRLQPASPPLTKG